MWLSLRSRLSGFSCTPEQMDLVLTTVAGNQKSKFLTDSTLGDVDSQEGRKGENMYYSSGILFFSIFLYSAFKFVYFHSTLPQSPAHR